MYKIIKTYGLIITAIVILCGFSLKGSVVEKTEKGNLLYEQKKYDDALQEYRGAQVDDPESPYLHFNIGTVLSKQKKYDEAIAELQKVQLPNDPVTASKAYYNIGIAQYRQAESELAKKNMQGAVDKLKLCIDSNIQAMRLNSNDVDSKYNVEQARKKMKQILDEMKKNQDQQKNQQQQKDQQQNQQQQQQNQKQNEQNKQQQQQQQQGNKSEEQKKQEEQQKQQQQGQDKKEQQQQQQQEQKAKQDEQNKDKQSQGAQQKQIQNAKMSKEDAERILNSLPEEERKSMQQYMQRQNGGDVQNMKNDW